MGQSDCIFCNIIARRAPGHFIYEQENVVAFLDIRPVKRGHALVVPKSHAQDLTEIAPALANEAFSVAHLIARSVRDPRVGADGANIVINDGNAAFQTVPHMHIHVIPRSHGDKARLVGGLVTRRGTRLPEVAATMRAAIEDTMRNSTD